MALHRDASKQSRWLDLIQRWQRSQLTIREFCQQHHVSEASFFSWRRTLQQRGLLDHSIDDPPAFVNLELPAEPTDSSVELVLGKRVLRLRPGFDPDMLRQLVRLLEEPTC
jgi:transposase-like protein